MQCSCGIALNLSLFRSHDGQPLKSCPKCSMQQGRHVFYPETLFGWRLLKGQSQLQSWCPACRSKRAPEQPATARCG
ncbi:hypothetical protein [Ferrimonas sp. SCSIO 43195]|uniref:hypothetical protein n=1 Tax=Ferrimonas sp. SCSIO 43195 TaxID=2822844 RepID=UPI00207590AF|nr:hypothetical protein [Ferrimonas sp. SCSIO 43195]USD36535.1 hypothetical protein J8Z22_16155 [Ferrimonas sp. SCSIO 43195]